MAIWLLDQEEGNSPAARMARNWPYTFAQLFETLLHRDVFNRKVLIGACAFAYFVGVTVLLYSADVVPPSVAQLWRASWAALCATVLPVAMSAYATRRSLRYLKRLKSTRYALAVLLAHTLLVCAFALLGFLFFTSFVHNTNRLLGIGLSLRDAIAVSAVATLPLAIRDFADGVRQVLTLPAGQGSFVLFFSVFPSLILSFGLWLYLLAGFLIKRTRHTSPFALSKWLEIENKPIRSIGLVAATIAAILYWILGSFVVLVS